MSTGGAKIRPNTYPIDARLSNGKTNIPKQPTNNLLEVDKSCDKNNPQELNTE
jgi:hypothetical protein